jgi:hypothetical protein
MSIVNIKNLFTLLGVLALPTFRQVNWLKKATHHQNALVMFIVSQWTV